MKAVTINSYGNSSVLNIEDIPIPETKSNEVLVQVKYSSINPIDIMKREGYGRRIFEKQRKPLFPWVIGSDFSGIVIKTGSKVTKFKDGDKVWGCTSSPLRGTYAEYVNFVSEEIDFMPTNIDFESAATIPYAALTTWAAIIRWAGLRPQDIREKKILVKAASGGVGTIAVQLFKHWQAFIATTSSKKNIDLLSNLGSDLTIDYASEDFSEIIKEFDIVYDCLGDIAGEEEVHKTINTLKPHINSQYITLNHPFMREIDSNGILTGVPKALLKRNVIKRKYNPIKIHWSLYRPSLSGLEEIRRLVEAGIIKPVLDSTYPIENIVKAHLKVESARTVGKVSLKVSD